MQTKFFKLCGLVLAGLSIPTAFGDAPPATQPTPRVEIFPFSAVSKTEDGGWVGRGIQVNLQSDVSRTGATLILPPHATPDGDDAIATAKQNHADLAVIGTYQVVGTQIRVNGNLVDVATNTSLGGFSATGQQSDLFKVEDALGEQFRSLLPRPISAELISQSTLPQAPAVAYQQPMQNYYSPPVTSYQDSTPAPIYIAPDYGDSYYPFGVYGGFGFYSGGYYGRGRGFSNHDFGHGYSGRPNFIPNPSFHNPVYHGGGLSLGSHGSGGGGFHSGGGRR